jgi:DNA-binding winged helix-turn-helix (wHTH) protein
MMKTSSAEDQERTEGPRGHSRADEAAAAVASEGGGPVAFRFADFELRLDSGELWKAGVAVKLQPRPARVLEMLARHAGEVVSREELRRAVWGEETYVDLDLALNFCIRQIRGALGDSADEPRFITTIPRRGYRFLETVEGVHRAPAVHRHLETPQETPHEAPPPSRERRSRAHYLFAACLAFMALALSPAGSREPAPSGDDSSAAMQAYLRGRDLQAHGASTEAIGAYQEATILAPRFAPAYASLADALLDRQRPAREGLPAIESAVRRALELDPNLPLAHLVLGESRFYYRFDWAGAEAEYRTALHLDPGNAEIHLTYAMLLASRGRRDEALRQAERARELAPDSIPDNADFLWLFYLLHRYDDAVAQGRRTLRLSPSSLQGGKRDFPTFWAYQVIMLAELARGDRPAALAAAQDEERWSGAPPLHSLAEFWERQARNRAQFHIPFLWYEPLVETERGEMDHAIDLLTEQCRERSSIMIPYLRADPSYDPLRGQPRFAELLRCANLAEAAAGTAPAGAAR